MNDKYKDVKHYIFNWHKNIKYDLGMNRNNLIMARDPKTATDVFMNTFGNLKNNTINYIQEIDPITKAPIGEKIIPGPTTKEPVVKITKDKISN